MASSSSRISHVFLSQVDADPGSSRRRKAAGERRRGRSETKSPVNRGRIQLAVGSVLLASERDKARRPLPEGCHTESGSKNLRTMPASSGNECRIESRFGWRRRRSADVDQRGGMQRSALSCVIASNSAEAMAGCLRIGGTQPYKLISGSPFWSNLYQQHCQFQSVGTKRLV